MGSQQEGAGPRAFASSPAPDVSPFDEEDLRSRVQKHLREVIQRQGPLLQQVGDELAPLLAALSDLLQGGKRLRPAFCYWGWRGAGAPDGDAIVAAASALELVQACALVHDDLMDGSNLRRGMPAAHRRFADQHRERAWRGSAERFGLGAAILLGDLSLSWADECLFGSGLSSDALLRAKPVYDVMRTELMAGQYLDLIEQVRGDGSLDRVLRVARYKAAKYTVERPLHLGAVLAGAPPEVLHGYTRFGLPLGEAFQLRDDVLGVFGDSSSTGKPAGDDLREGKWTALAAVASERSTPAQAEAISRLLGHPELGDDGVATLREILTATGALDHVERLIRERTAQALAALDEAAGIDDRARDVLRRLALAATTRTV